MFGIFHKAVGLVTMLPGVPPELFSFPHHKGRCFGTRENEVNRSDVSRINHDLKCI